MLDDLGVHLELEELKSCMIDQSPALWRLAAGLVSVSAYAMGMHSLLCCPALKTGRNGARVIPVWGRILTVPEHGEHHVLFEVNRHAWTGPSSLALVYICGCLHVHQRA